MDLVTAPHYLDIQVFTGIYKQGVPVRTAVKMEPCTHAHWAKLGNQTDNFYQLYRMWQCLCPPLDFIVELEGKFTFPELKDLEFQIRKCTGVIGVDCRTATEINDFLVASNYQFMLGIFYIDTLVDPGNEDPYSYYINDDFYWGFSPQQGIQVKLNLRTQTINTDNSLLPVEDIKTIVSPVVEPAWIGSYTIVDPTAQNYVIVYVLLSTTGVRITRSFYKFDELLAYLGGLFGLIALIVDLPLRAYNQVCQDVGLSHYLYDYSDGSSSAEQKIANEQELTEKKKGSDQTILPSRSLQVVAPMESSSRVEEVAA